MGSTTSYKIILLSHFSILCYLCMVHAVYSAFLVVHSTCLYLLLTPNILMVFIMACNHKEIASEDASAPKVQLKQNWSNHRIPHLQNISLIWQMKHSQHILPHKVK